MSTQKPHPDLPGAPGDYLLPKSRFDDKVVRGKDGWLFLDRDSNQVMLQHTGELQLSDAELQAWRLVLETRVAWLEERGIPYFFLVPPNSHSVYPEKLPDSVVVRRQRPIEQLLGHLDHEGSPAHPIYPLEELVARKDQRPYAQTSSHWTDLGAFVAYQRLADEMARSVPIRRVMEADVTFAESMFCGDLGMKVDPEEQSLHPFAIMNQGESRLVYDNRVFVNGHRIELECPAAPEVTCLLLGDSFSNMVLPFLAESFRRLVFGHIWTLDRSLVEEVRPDVVIGVLNERFLVHVPVDVPSASLEELAAQKRARGEVYPPGQSRGDQWRTPGDADPD